MYTLNLDPDIVSEKVVKSKRLYELMEENTDVSDLLPESNKKYNKRMKRKMKTIF